MIPVCVVVASGLYAAWCELRLRYLRRPEAPRRGIFALPDAFSDSALFVGLGQKYQRRAKIALLIMYAAGIVAIVVQGAAG
jgi:hypothetical protein